MKLTRITYSRLASLGQYRNERIELTAILADEEEVSFVLEALRSQVVALLSPDENQLYLEFKKLQRDVSDLEKRRTDAWQKYQQVKDFMSAQGLKDMPDFPAGLPILAPGSNLEPEQFEIVEDDEDDEDYKEDAGF